MLSNLLSILIWLPIAGGVLTLLVGGRNAQAARWVALGTTLSLIHI